SASNLDFKLHRQPTMSIACADRLNRPPVGNADGTLLGGPTDMVPPSLRTYLDDHRVAYRVLAHEARFTAQETAAAAHVSGRRFAKVVLLEGDYGGKPQFLLAVLPGHEEVDLDRLGQALGRPVQLAAESAFGRVCPEFEAGAAPPFSELAHVPVVADR